MIAAHAFSSNAYRMSTFSKLKAEARIPSDAVLCLWNLVRTAVRQYQGYKRGFGKMVQTEMEVNCLRRWRNSSLAVKLRRANTNRKTRLLLRERAAGFCAAERGPQASSSLLKNPLATEGA